MFTGLIEERGRVTALEPLAGGRRLHIAARRVLEDLAVGASVAVDGCCLTVTALDSGFFAVEAVPETLARTTLGSLAVGDGVNLERALALGERLGGHLVQGHVDGVGVVRALVPEGEGRRLRLEVPEPLRRFVAEKGSIAVDGVSLTVAAGTPDGCEIALIPHTLEATGMGGYAPGRRVNLEVDLLARYLARLLDASGVAGRK
jgi:riboflavin synthase